MVIQGYFFSKFAMTLFGLAVHVHQVRVTF